ncbi:MAG: PLP-dependent aspartate aminotransferase family protein [Gammaproteobacteria bacterium]
MKNKFDTRLVHGSGTHGASLVGKGVVPGIELSTTFERSDPRSTDEYIYSRTNNPNRDELEERICSLENGAAAAAFASGSAASMAVFQSLPAGSHVIVTGDAYYGTLLQLNKLVTRMGHSVSAVDTSNVSNVENAWQDNTALVWIETPSNPQMNVSDIRSIAELAHARGAKVGCDNTLATCLWQQPLELGADFSMHSSTKFLGGHSDVLGGVIIARSNDEMFARVREAQQIGGAVPSPFDCWLLLRSIATLSVRVRQQTKSADTLARHFSDFPGVQRVLYVGLESHPGYALNKTQMERGGALLSLLIDGTADQAIQVASHTRVIKQATSLGGVESLIEHRYSVEGETSVSPPNLLRLSVGLEDPEDLIEDLEHAIAKAFG